MDTLEGMAAIRDLGAAESVGLVYVDADHSKDAVLEDIRTAARCFPNALCCGDDWQWPGVRAAVEQHVAESLGRLQLHSRDAENWWWLEKTAVAAPAAAVLREPRVALEFVKAAQIGAFKL
ncbi:hypothetical protein T492DRAFT_842453 [Pavlovales sp. CCMP2436]|nr:hypothetical protein T492DRAFT_842453 [Pavlovales sp. CCMP2436]